MRIADIVYVPIVVAVEEEEALLVEYNVPRYRYIYVYILVHKFINGLGCLS